ncbi:MAG: peptidyl-prolyl cis-trans isomerase [Deltaproteobacteria bacterium]|nr:peptidyl-prolyl cis-trans isomerase [Deltaproteobacteria bacterium]
MRSSFSRAIRDPLVHFVVLGAVIFVVHAELSPEPITEDARVLVVDDDYLEALTRERVGRLGREATEADRDEMRASWVREEALVREARALGLDAGDAIVRRRLVQKLELLVRSSVVTAEPTDDELAAYLEAHAEDYVAPADVSFDHRFFSRERRGARTVDDARAAALDPDAAASGGDPFPHGNRFERRPFDAVEDVLGPELVPALRDSSVGAWSSPIETRFGVHLVRVTERREARPLTLDEVRRDVRARVREEAEAAALEAALDAIVAAYVIEERP